MKIVLFGGNGYIGSEFVKQILPNPNIQLRLLPSRGSQGKVHSQENLESLITTFQPQAVINCAAYVGGNSISNCESNFNQVVESNVIFPRMLGEICHKHQIVLGHMSSGCLFTGYPYDGYKENDRRNMCDSSQYLRSKALAEDLLEFVPKKYIWRIRLPFDESPSPRNLLTKILKFDKLVVARNSISHRKELVEACLECIIRQVPFGTYHVTNPGDIRADEITTLFRRLRGATKEFNYFESIEAFNKTSPIPRSNTILNTDKLIGVGIKMTPIYEKIVETIQTYDTGRT